MHSRWQHVLDPELSTASIWSSNTNLPVDEPKREVEVVVLGDGFVGLSAALALAAHGKDVCVVRCTDEAAVLDEAGLGLIDPPEQDDHANLTAALPIALSLDRPLFLAAASSARFHALAQRHATQGGRSDTLVDAARQWEVMGSAYYRGGLIASRGGALDVGSTLSQLASALAKARVPRAAALRVLEKHGDRWALQLDGVAFVATTLLITAPVRAVVPSSLADQVIPRTVPSHNLVTEPLPRELAVTLSPQCTPVREVSRCAYESRLDPSGRRFMFREPVKLDRSSPQEGAVRLYRQMLARWPQLRGVRITHSWVGESWHLRRPHAAQDAGSVYHCWGSGCDAAGLLRLGAGAGHAVAAGRNPSLPPTESPARKWLLPLADTYRRWADGLERRRH